MDPNENVRERIALYRKLGNTPRELARIDELERTYTCWRSCGGFPASDDLLREFARVRQIRRRTQ
jgi:hypothetical protein